MASQKKAKKPLRLQTSQFSNDFLNSYGSLSNFKEESGFFYKYHFKGDEIYFENEQKTTRLENENFYVENEKHEEMFCLQRQQISKCKPFKDNVRKNMLCLNNQSIKKTNKEWTCNICPHTVQNIKRYINKKIKKALNTKEKKEKIKY